MVAGKKEFLKDDKRFGGRLILFEFLRLRLVTLDLVAGITSKRYGGAFCLILCKVCRELISLLICKVVQPNSRSMAFLDVLRKAPVISLAALFWTPSSLKESVTVICP